MTDNELYTESSFSAPINLADPQVFNAIWGQYQTSLFYLAFAFLQNQQEAEDVATESFIKLWNNRSQFTSALSVRSWLRTTTRNASLNLLKQQKARQNRLSEIAKLLNEAEEQWNQEDILAQLLQTIYKEIEALPPKSREVFKLRYLKGMTNKEIANQIGIHHQSVRDHLVRAFKTLRLTLDKNSHLLGLFLLLFSHHD